MLGYSICNLELCSGLCHSLSEQLCVIWEHIRHFGNAIKPNRENQMIDEGSLGVDPHIIKHLNLYTWGPFGPQC